MCTFVPENKTCQFGKAACILDVSRSKNYHAKPSLLLRRLTPFASSLLGTFALSSAEASLYCGEAFVLWGGWGERKRERAGNAVSLFPSFPARFLFLSIIDILMGIPSGSLCGGERYIWQLLKKKKDLKFMRTTSPYLSLNVCAITGSHPMSKLGPVVMEKTCPG